MKFYKIDNFWWELEGVNLYNMAGGRQLASWYDIKDSDVIEVDDWCDLDWADTSIHDNTLKTGWIDRDGKFYGCDYEWHSKQAEFIHKKTLRELELLGWVKVYKSMFFNNACVNGLSFIIGSRLNELQKHTLYKLDFTDEELQGVRHG